MQIPGSTIDVELTSHGIEIRDRGVIKSVMIGGKTFEDVLTDIQRFVYLRGHKIPRSVVKILMISIGLPKVKAFPEEAGLTDEDNVELSRAKEAIESLADAYLSPKSAIEISEDSIEEVPMPEPVEVEVANEVPIERTGIWEIPADRVDESKLTYSFHAENLPKDDPEQQSEKPQRTINPIRDDVAPPAPESSSAPSDNDINIVKATIVGQPKVGATSLLASSGFVQHQWDGQGDPLERGFVPLKKSISLDDCNVDIRAWSFYKAMRSRVSSSKFYAGTGVLVIIYSVIDKETFDAVDFWVQEALLTFLVPPPILIVGTMTDLRDTIQSFDDKDADVLTYEQGLKLSRRIAKDLGVDGRPHPVSFYEASSASGEGVDTIFESVVQLWKENGKISFPVIQMPDFSYN